MWLRTGNIIQCFYLSLQWKIILKKLKYCTHKALTIHTKIPTKTSQLSKFSSYIYQIYFIFGIILPHDYPTNSALYNFIPCFFEA